MATQNGARFLVIIPAKDEAQSLPGVLGELRRVHPPDSTVVIDDGSRDETAQIASRMGCVVLRHPFNLGYGASLMTGYLYAVRNGFKHILQMDADGQHPPDAMPELLGPVLDGQADLVVGSRYLDSHGLCRGGGSDRLRRFGARNIARIASLWTGRRITDPTSGFQALSARAVRQLCSDGFPDDYPDVDVLINLHRAGLRLREIAVRMRPRLRGSSMHRGLRVVYYFYRLSVSLLLLPIRRSSPYRNERRRLDGHGAGGDPESTGHHR
ncbi:MAG: glycosyltransferase family 2 protein [Planctomycetota bacterium]